MTRTLVVQSCRLPVTKPWLQRCLDSVRRWSEANGYHHRLLGDELFDRVASDLRHKTRSQPVIATDLARLRLLQEALDAGYDTAVWMDADFLIFDAPRFELPATSCAVGREVWVQHDGRGRLKVYTKVHNAFLMARSGDAFLDFYADTAERLLRASTGPMPPQFIGPKLLTALHNVAQLPVMETAGMLSPAVARDLIDGGGPALQRFRERSPQPVAGANLCGSSLHRGELTQAQMLALIDALA